MCNSYVNVCYDFSQVSNSFHITKSSVLLTHQLVSTICTVYKLLWVIKIYGGLFGSTAPLVRITLVIGEKSAEQQEPIRRRSLCFYFFFVFLWSGRWPRCTLSLPLAVDWQMCIHPILLSPKYAAFTLNSKCGNLRPYRHTEWLYSYSRLDCVGRVQTMVIEVRSSVTVNKLFTLCSVVKPHLFHLKEPMMDGKRLYNNLCGVRKTTALLYCTYVDCESSDSMRTQRYQRAPPTLSLYRAGCWPTSLQSASVRRCRVGGCRVTSSGSALGDPSAARAPQPGHAPPCSI